MCAGLKQAAKKIEAVIRLKKQKRIKGAVGQGPLIEKGEVVWF